MVKRRPRNAPAVQDWHLWSEVARSVSPLRSKKGRVVPPAKDRKRASGTTADDRPPKSDPPPANSPARGGGALFRDAPGAPRNPGAVWHPAEPAFTHTHAPVDLKGGLEPRVHRRLRRGQVPIDGTIDLHGMRQDEARTALHRYVRARVARGDRTILVITGKGLKKAGYGMIAERGVLRHMLAVWLNEPGLREHVAGWEVSARHHGGEGAFYVRLKRAPQ